MPKIKSYLALILSLAILLPACANLKTRRQLGAKSLEESRQTSKRNESVSEPQVKVEESQVDPGPLPINRPQVGVVLGPGGMKAFAHAGVLRELRQASIPIDYIVGLEWGSLVAALYASTAEIHNLEWQLYKLEQKDLPRSGFFSSGFKAENVSILEKFLKDRFGKIKISEAKVPFACPSLSLWSGTVVWQKTGSMQKAVERCLPYPPLFKPKSPWMASAFSLRQAINLLKQKNVDILIFVNVLGSGDLLDKDQLIADYETAILWQELRRLLNRDLKLATDVITVNTSRYMLFDFEKRQKLVQLGRQAGKRQAKRLIEKYGF